MSGAVYDPAYALFLARSPGNQRAAVHYWRNTAGPRAQSWQRFSAMADARYEMRRALLGIDGPNAWCGRNARLRRYILAIRRYPPPVLP